MFGSPEKRAEKEHQKALKELRWAFKASGVHEGQLQAILNGGDNHIILLTDHEMVWVKQGTFGGGKVKGRVPRDSVVGVRRETGWNDGWIFKIVGAALPDGNKFPYGGDAMFQNTFNFFTELSYGRLLELINEEDQKDPFGFMRKLDFEFAGAGAAVAAAPPPVPGAAPPPPPVPPAGPPPPPRQAPPPLPGGGETEDIPAMIRKVAELRDAGVLTEEEFAAKKRELLSRM